MARETILTMDLTNFADEVRDVEFDANRADEIGFGDWCYSHAAYRELFAVLDRWPARAKFIRNAVERGRFEGGVYWDSGQDCGCFYGHYVNGRLEERDQRASQMAQKVRDALGGYMQTPLEDFVVAITVGDTPDSSATARRLRDAIEQWATERGVDLGPRPTTTARRAS